MDSTLKILVAGDVKGKYSKLFKRVSDVNLKAGPFDLLLCVGDFFGTDYQQYDELINGSTELPNVPTYVLGTIPCELLKFHPNVDNFDQGCELIDGITFLGRSSILTTSSGLKIAYLNGTYRTENVSSEKDENLLYFTKSDYESLLMNYQASHSPVIDILITTQWPKNIFKYANIDSIDEELRNSIDKNSSSLISQLCLHLLPRYHFCSKQDLFYERVPYRNHQVLNEQPKNVTRFINLADIENKKKMKWLYAFNVVPSKNLSKKDLVTQPSDTSENPFKNLMSNDDDDDDAISTQQDSRQFFYDIKTIQSDEGDKAEYSRNKRDHMSDRKPRKQMKVDLANCWFCLASPNVDKTLIVSIGDYSYIALAKGGLTDDHLMILPIEHIRSTVEIEDENLQEEIDRFKKALIDFFSQRQRVPVFFERNFRSAHFQIQVIGLPLSKAPSLKDAVSKVFSNLEHHELSTNSDLIDVLSPGVPYFYCECPGHYKFFVKINTKKEFFPIQIGRELLAHPTLLNCPERIDWRSCASNTEEAQQLTKSIRSEFKSFDFTT